MKNLLNYALVVCGFALATIATSSNAIASDSNGSSSRSAGSCVGSGNCGTTSQGTELYGKWTEGSSSTSTIGAQ